MSFGFVTAPPNQPKPHQFMRKALLTAISRLPFGLLSACLPLGLLVAGCQATTPQIDTHEDYRGPLIAAITPVGGSVDQVNDWVLRHKLEQALAERICAAAIFSAVEETPSATAPNEAEIIIEPRFLQQPGLAPERQGELAVHISARRKTKGTVALDRDYRVPCASCALGTLDPEALRTLSNAINRDLRQQFGTTRVN